MAITFKSIQYRNFLSTGNVANKIELNRSPTTLIIGKNGGGKSTILDAITFSLFNKPFRNINRGQLINSINLKQCEVQIEFDVDNISYKVIRGIKPNIFEIWKNGVLLNQDAATKDYQNVLETQILKLNFKTFNQVVILGSASYVSFMQLPASLRRDVIEDILDIKIFSTMNQILKSNISMTKDALIDVDTNLKITKTKTESQKTIIGLITQSHTDKINKIHDSIRENEVIINDLEHKTRLLSVEIDDNKKLIINKNDIEDQIDGIRTDINMAESTLKQYNRDIKFFTDTTNCQTCKRDIDDTHKVKIIVDMNTKVNEITKTIHEMKIIYESKRMMFHDYEQISEQISEQLSLYSSHNNSIKFLKQKNDKLYIEVEELENNTGDVDLEKTKLNTLIASAVEDINKRKVLLEEKSLQEVAAVLLKDTGIKTAIIKEYLPILNKLINQYLMEMDSYIRFELDENFNEIIKSRFRDDFSYSSFSEGEKMRIDLSLLFTWRHLAQMKNSINCNLLILDETLDKNLDDNGTNLLLKILSNLSKNTNVFLISHKGEVLLEKFENIIEFVKRNEFSIIV